MSSIEQFVPDRGQWAYLRVESVLETVSRWLFRDRLGLALFLGTLCFAGLFVRGGVFITDTYAIANGLVALSEGHLWIGTPTYGSVEAPGMHLYDGKLYARNYGQIAASVPILWALQGLSRVFDPGLLFAALWSVCLLGIALQIGHLLDRWQPFAVGGSIVATAAFLVNVSVARPIPAKQLPLLALKLGVLLAAGLTVVVCYRLLSRLYDRQVGFAAALVLLTATPVGLWARVSKRHVFSTLAVVAIMYALYRSREETPTGRSSFTPVQFRAFSYAIVALLAWIHAAEALVLLFVLAPIDVLTAPSNDRRTVAVVSATFLVALIPMFVTNVLISGDPFTVPRMLPSVWNAPGGDRGQVQVTAMEGPEINSGSSSGSSSVLPGPVRVIVTKVLWPPAFVFESYRRGIATIFRAPGRLSDIFIRGGYIETIIEGNENRSVYLTVFESAPVLAGITAALGALPGFRGAVSRLRCSLSAPIVSGPNDSRFVVDLFVVGTFVAFLLLYVPSLPLHAQVTVRYLLVFYPLGVYALARQSSIRRVLETHCRVALWTWLVGVCIGAQLLVVAGTLGPIGIGGKFQMHAVLNLVVAAVLGVLAALTRRTERFDSLAAVAFGLAVAMGTNFLLLSGLAYGSQLGFDPSHYVLPAVDVVADFIASA